MAADYEIIAAQLLRINSRNHVAWNDWGVGIFNEAMKLPPDVAEPMFADAVRKFAVAVDLSPSTAIYWQNHGVANLQRGIRNTSENKIAIFEDACHSYERAIRLAPRNDGAWCCLATCYAERAKLTELTLSASLHSEAFIRFAVATELAPTKYGVWYDWGTALLNYAYRLDNHESLPLLLQAIQNYNRAATLNPEAVDPLNNAAVCLMELAKQLTDMPGAIRWLADAEASMTQAISLSPETGVHWFNRATVLVFQSRHTTNTNKKKLLEESDAHFIIANRLNPDSHMTLNNWGNVFHDLAGLADTDSEHIALLEQANAKYAAAITLESNIAMYWSNWGSACTQISRLVEPEEAMHLRKEALAKYTVANKLLPGNQDNMSQWSDALVLFAKHANDEAESEKLLQQAEDNAEQLMRLKADMSAPWLLYGSIYRRRATFTTETSKRTSFLKKSHEHYRQANKINPEKAIYELASIAALEENVQECRALLENALARDLLPPPRTILRDDDFLSVRDEVWFRQLLERIPRNTS